MKKYAYNQSYKEKEDFINNLKDSVKYEAVEKWGVKTTNTASENDIAILDALNSMKKNSHGLQFSAGIYKFSASWGEFGYEDFFAVKGITEVSQDNFHTSIIKRTSNVTLIKINGNPLFVDANLHQGAIFRDISFNGDDREADLIQCFSAQYMKWDNVRIVAVNGTAVHMWEVFDSRVYNLSLDYTGNSDGSKAGLLLRSGTYDDGTGSVTREFTNEVHFIGMRMENCRGISLQTAGASTNNCKFTNCKWESTGNNLPTIQLNEALAFRFTDCYLVGSIGTVGGVQESLITLNDCSGFTYDGVIIAFLNTIANNDIETLVKINNSDSVNIKINSSDWNDRITSDYLIDVSGCTKENIDGFILELNGLPFNKRLFDGWRRTGIDTNKPADTLSWIDGDVQNNKNPVRGGYGSWIMLNSEWYGYGGIIGGQPIGFTPANLTNLELWLDASDSATITESGGAVSQWNDKSGNVRHATQATGANQPTLSTFNGRQCINFDNSIEQWFSLVAVNVAGNNNVVYIVLDSVGEGSSTVQRILQQQQSGGTRHGIELDTNGNIKYNNVTDGTSGNPTYKYRGNKRIIVAYRNGTQVGVGYGGVFETTSISGNVVTLDNSYIGAYNNGASEGFNGKICEIIIQTNYDSDEIFNTLAYLNDKWSI